MLMNNDGYEIIIIIQFSDDSVRGKYVYDRITNKNNFKKKSLLCGDIYNNNYYRILGRIVYKHVNIIIV